MNANKKALTKNIFAELTIKNRSKAYDREEIKNFSSMFRGTHNIYEGNKIVDHTGHSKLINLLKKKVVPYRFSLWGSKTNGKYYSRFIAVEGKEGIDFIIPPTYKIYLTRKKVQYLWELTEELSYHSYDRLKFLSDLICYLHPGTASLHRKGDTIVCIPGIPHCISGMKGKLLRIGKNYVYEEIKDALEKLFPVTGKSLQKFVRSEKLFIPGIKSTRQFIGLKRANILLNMKWKKRIFQKKRQNILFLLQNFLYDTGLKQNEIERILYNWCQRRRYKIDEQDLLDTKPVKRYCFTNTTICRLLGIEFRKYFPYKERIDKANEIRIKIADYANLGKTVKEIAALLHVSESKVKRRRSEAVKLGMIVKKAK